ncbi:flagellar basal-body rod protein FlgG [Clostridium acetireducens DSM 10703]|uniref:Flagellar basal-body rod protein FlgG n=1 Tax=Clostridium acetireducens DSM 10703 TaxID=1121290 RepID=A0A1E8EUZ2_9CLOT|nr:flagellar hook-basal body complex protein [Clostridium acetireducens]OFH98050.1 flagellar basal-body rod protein FlgG [Clostridium acetireducens DSM 10703]
MLRALWNSKSGMTAQQNKLDCISNNIANVNTDGYKREDLSFQDLVYETLERRGYPVSENRPKEPFTGSGVKTGNWIRDNVQGSLKETGSKTDMAIDGKGYFKVITNNGAEAYIRSGNFIVDVDGSIVDKSGNKLSILNNNGAEINALPANNPNKVRFTENNFYVNSDGTVHIKVDSMYNNVYDNVGNIQLYDVVGNDSLMSVGSDLYIPKEGTNLYTVTKSNILQGHLERSNVDMGKEMTDMLVTQRAFELNSRAIRTADEMWGMANNLKSR